MKKLNYLICNTPIIIIIVLVHICAISKAQDIQYTYDPAGNRVYREYVILRLSANTAGSNQEDAEKLKEEMDIEIFPNPTEDVVNVSINNFDAKKKITLEVYDSAGKLLQTSKLTSTSSRINFKEYKPGIYHVGILVDKQSVFYQILKK